MSETSRPEPFFNAPGAVVGLILVIIALHGFAAAGLFPEEVLAFTRQDMESGRLDGLITSQFAHGGWAHVLMNASFILAFGAPVARHFGPGWKGTIAFLTFFLLGGSLAALGYAAAMAAASENWALIGASGAASALFGGATRLLGGGGTLSGLFSRQVVRMTVGWIAVNVVLGLSGLTPGAAGLPVAWQAHIAGFFAGLILMGPWSAWTGPREIEETYGF
jgi:membrane associated rhomboid family serine protease